MNPKCARCDKTVYPMEKLNCLDKYWHKGCFSCEVCKMTLTMKNYKGYNKLPYCSAHYPTTKFTAVADTPENRRLASNTQKQSNIQYHKDFEAAKGHYTAVADDPETKRAQESNRIASQVAYTQHSSGQSRLGVQQRSQAEVKEIHQHQRRLSQEHPMASSHARQPAPPPQPETCTTNA
ncbi:LIM and SH3 domain protein 1 [Desmophyllum pertusum]|uniref:LIM and SH3 domain protein 1 n=1 Tax=Desmophyllum pertusum TaxID=174260 RepID=A0A9X0CTE9_9CNID|nr:LIM and SH3 domain protein 1 [Desmophyllum pertusum]